MTAANTLTSLRKVHYSKQIETNLHDTLIMNDLANDRSSEFPDGITFEVPQIAYMQVGNYAGTLATKGVVSQKSTLTMNLVPIVSWTYDDVDVLKDSWDVLARVDTNSVYKLKQQMEGDFFSQYASCRYRNTIPTAVLTTSNSAFAVISNAVATLIHAGVNPAEVCVVVDPFTADVVAREAISSTFSLSDESFQRGYTRSTVSGAMLYRNSNLSATYTLDIATQPTNTDFLTINGVRFTFVSNISTTHTDPFTGLATTSGNILIETDVNTTVSYLIESINAAATGVAGANVAVKYVALSADDADLLTGFTASDGTDQMLLVSKHGYRPVSTINPATGASSMTNANNDWAAAYTHALVMAKGAFSVAYRRGLKTDKRPIATSLEYNYSNYLLWGKTVTVDGAKKAYDLIIMSQSAES